MRGFSFSLKRFLGIAQVKQQINTCPHQCEYCYANTNPKAALTNWKRFRGNKDSESISGDF